MADPARQLPPAARSKRPSQAEFALGVGGIELPDLVRSIVTYHGKAILQVTRGDATTDTHLSLQVHASDRRPSPHITHDSNGWLARSSSAYRIEIDGTRLSLSSSDGDVSLRMRADSPAKMVIEHLDLRCGQGHVLATEHTYALGRYIDATRALWVHAPAKVRAVNADTVAFEFATADDLLSRLQAAAPQEQSVRTSDGRFVFSGIEGFMCLTAGIAVATRSVGMRVHGAVTSGIRTIEETRSVFERTPHMLPNFVATDRRA